jgi:hypothetical protein
MAIVDDGVARVVASGIAGDVIKRRCKVVDDFTLSFVAPLRADNCDRLCSGTLCHRNNSRPHVSRLARSGIRERYREAGAATTNARCYAGPDLKARPGLRTLRTAHLGDRSITAGQVRVWAMRG